MSPQTAGAIGFVGLCPTPSRTTSLTPRWRTRTARWSLAWRPSAPQSRARTRDPANGFGTVLTDQPGAGTWPIAGATFVLVYGRPQDQAATEEALKFFQWAYKTGDQMAAGLDYVPFPDAVKQKVMGSWTQIQGWNGGS